MRPIILAPMLALALSACRPDDVKTDDSAAPDDSAGGDDSADDSGGDDSGDGGDASALHHTWLSEGEDLAPAFTDESATYQITSVTATFNADGSYVVSAKIDGIARPYEFAGTYTADMGTTPHGITLNQATVNGSANVITAVGIWQVDGTTLTYETIQTDPDLGCDPPTASGGFGSTTCDVEIEAGYYTQVYQQSE